MKAVGQEDFYSAGVESPQIIPIFVIVRSILFDYQCII